MISLENICKSHADEVVLKDLSVDFSAETTNAICGRSGSGKTTLLYIIASFIEPSEGKVLIDGRSLSTMTARDQCTYRRQSLGYIYQSHYLVPSLTSLENVQLVASLWSGYEKDAHKRSKAILKEVGLDGKYNHYPYQLSGGEQQRVGIARALVNEQRIILADEPTGNLDSETGDHIIDLLLNSGRKRGSVVLIATHSSTLAERTDKTYHISDGILEDQSISA